MLPSLSSRHGRLGWKTWFLCNLPSQRALTNHLGGIRFHYQCGFFKNDKTDLNIKICLKKNCYLFLAMKKKGKVPKKNKPTQMLSNDRFTALDSRIQIPLVSWNSAWEMLGRNCSWNLLNVQWLFPDIHHVISLVRLAKSFST